MFPDFLLDLHNFYPEVRFAPDIVTSYIQIELVDVGESRERNEFADIKRNNVHQGWNTAETKVYAPPPPLLEHLKLFWD